MTAIQKTHFADDDTLKYIADMEQENSKLWEALRAMYKAQHAGPITPEMYDAWTKAGELLRAKEAA